MNHKNFYGGKYFDSLDLLKIRKITVGPLMTDCYILSNRGKCVIVDAGGNPDKIIEELEKFNLEPVFIMATHGHFDHFLSAKDIQKRYEIPFYINELDLPMLYNEEYSADHFIKGLKAEIPGRIATFREGFSFVVGDHRFNVIETPGHTPGSSCIIGNGFILTGDTLFKMSIGRMDYGGNEEDMVRSLKRLAEMKESTRIYPGHGDPSDIRYELLNNFYFQNVANKNSLY